MEHYNSDCEPDYLRQRDRRLDESSMDETTPSPAPGPGPAPEVTYAQPHQQRTSLGGSPLKVSTVSAGKYQSNANLGLFPNSSSSGSSIQNSAGLPGSGGLGGGGVTSTVNTPRSTNPFLSSSKFPGDDSDPVVLPASASSSTAASNSHSNRSHRNSGATRSTLNRLSQMTSSSSDSMRHPQLKQLLHPEENPGVDPARSSSRSSGTAESEEPPPEPAPPEIPPRTQSLLMSLRKHSDYKLKYEEKGDQKHEEFIPTSQLQKDYLISDNLRSDQQLKPLSPGDSNG
ncbi:hypothetical protein KR026_000779 [Drosophila bipectinata]|nr:hypothetical protein KR026_000779 [Drosophila bipectinata]